MRAITGEGAISAAGGLASQADLARRWGMSRQRVHQLIPEPYFRAPAGLINRQPVWLPDEADHWYRSRSAFLARCASENSHN